MKELMEDDEDDGDEGVNEGRRRQCGKATAEPEVEEGDGSCTQPNGRALGRPYGNKTTIWHR
jgi:hypothetical protein